jgi:hypothetical protein
MRGVTPPNWTARLRASYLTLTVKAAPALKKLSALQIRQTLSGKVITDGTHWTYYLKSNGAIDAFEMKRARKGHWHLDDNRLCIAINAGAAPDRCFDVMWEGKNLVFGIDGQVIYDVKVKLPEK